MEFRLTYVGPLATSSPVQAKHEIRRQLHPQLRDLCGRSVLLHYAVKAMQGTVLKPEPHFVVAGQKYLFGEFHFLPIVICHAHIACHLDILFLRREQPGALITRSKDEYGGDLDNRLKIFFDALRVPNSVSEVPKDAAPSDDERPFLCLLEDDSLITKFQVESDTLLGTTTPERQKDVQLVVTVTTEPIQEHSL
jgi:hypothetical protein